MRLPLVVTLGVLAGCATLRIAPDDEKLYRVGRFSNDGRFLWSGSRFSLHFEGSGLVRARLRQNTHPGSAEAGPQPLRIRAELDGVNRELYADARGELLFQSDVPPGDYHFSLVRQSEALVGEGQLLEIELSENSRVVEWNRKGQALLEFIGDSVTVGFGNEGKAPCLFSSRTQAFTAAFPALVGRALKADVRVVGWSGHGVAHNWSDRPEPVLPEQWRPASPPPDVVFLGLGSNDWWNGDPGPGFLTAYQAFVARVQQAYPDAKLYSIAWGPRRDVFRSAGLDPIELEDTDLDHDGCVGHPSARAHQRVAEVVTARVCLDAPALCGKAR
ncbi:MAG: hypothetical protein IPJ65_36335 [Archangiaceae bacterium]|nr:hypothetical protein [Archangiaceae bacterium]